MDLVGSILGWMIELLIPSAVNDRKQPHSRRSMIMYLLLALVTLLIALFVTLLAGAATV